jgi:serine/threonine-protein kinase RsbW
MSKIATLSIIDDKKLLPGVLSFIDSIVGNLDFSETKLLMFKMACEAMISNRIENAYEDGGIIDVDIDLAADMLEVSVRDIGAPYWQVDTYTSENVDKNSAGLEKSLIATMCDYSGCEKLGRDGQREFVRLYLQSPMAENRATRSDSTECAPENVSVSIKETTGENEDIISAITCIYDEYRYTYGYEKLYYPENFRELINAGKLRSFLAVGDNGEIAGHYSLLASNDCPGMPEWATIVIRRPFRGRHIFGRMCGHGVETAIQSGARAIMTRPTTYYTATQRVAEKYGYTATGFLFRYVNSDMESEFNKEGRRHDLAIAVRFLTERPKGVVYIPEEHSGFIIGIYEKLGAEYEFRAGCKPEQKTLLRHEINSIMKSGRVVVKRVGSDINRELAHTTGVIRRKKAEMIEILINMSDPSAPIAYETAKNNGYFFTGIMPGGENGDFLIMQNLFEGVIDTKSIATTGEYTELLRYLSETVNNIK